jgi:hypothetical protein
MQAQMEAKAAVAAAAAVDKAVVALVDGMREP